MATNVREIEIYGGELTTLSPSIKEKFPWDVTPITEDGKNVGYKVAIPKREFNEFKVSLSMSIVQVAATYYFSRFLKGKLQEGVIESVITNHQHSIEMPQYFFPLTLFILDEYFKHNSKINLSSFIKFNMPGFKKEILTLSAIEANLGGKLITVGSRVETPSEDKSNDIKELIHKMVLGYPEHGDMDANSRILVFCRGDEVLVTNKRLQKIDMEYLGQQTGIEVGFKTEEDPHDAAITLLILAWEVFTPRSCVVYNSVEKEFREHIAEDVKFFNDHHEEQINLMFSKDNMPHIR